MNKKRLAIGIACLIVIIVLIVLAECAIARSNETISRVDQKIDLHERSR